MNVERQALLPNTIIHINENKIMIDKYLGSGTTCLVYEGRMIDEENGLPFFRVIVKEFYPVVDDYDIVREKMTGNLVFSERVKNTEAFTSKERLFVSSYKIQNQMANSALMEITVKPYYFRDYGNTGYLINDVHMGRSLEKIKFETLQDKLECVIRLSEIFGVLHEQGFVMLDFKPENILWTEKPKSARLLDVDSIVQYEERENWGYIEPAETIGIADNDYCAPEIHAFRTYLESGKCTFGSKKDVYVNPEINVYSLGVYLFELLFGRFPTENDKKFGNSLCEELYERYRNCFSKKELAEELLEVIETSIQARSCYRYEDAYTMMDALNEIMGKITAQKYIPKKQVAQANATFAAYNMLEKYPLYCYIKQGTERKKTEKKQIRVALLGCHAMRKGMLSALLSVGQMLDTDLVIDIVAEDAKEFWDLYISEEQNPALKRAVTWSLNGEMISGADNIDKNLVTERLAHIQLHTDKSFETMKRLYKEGNRYFVFLEDENLDNQKWVEKLSEIVTVYLYNNDAGEKNDLRNQHGADCFIGYLWDSSKGKMKWKAKKSERVQLFEISRESFSEIFNENMYKEHIYQMGLMVHAYYHGCMQDDFYVEDINSYMKKLEENFRTDLYAVESSERCALHGVYKMASIGVYREIPGKVLRYYKQIQNPEILERLAWLEHRSWTAYMLTTGAVPLPMNEFEDVAYKYGNDWKDKRDKNHIRHPLLVSSEIQPKKKLLETDFFSEISDPINTKTAEYLNDAENLKDLDMLDQISYKISLWYQKKPDRISGAEKYKKRDFKQYDRELVKSVLDMLG